MTTELSDESKRALGLVPAQWSITTAIAQSPGGNPNDKRHVIVRVTYLPTRMQRVALGDRLAEPGAATIVATLAKPLIAELDPTWREPEAKKTKPKKP